MCIDVFPAYLSVHTLPMETSVGSPGTGVKTIVSCHIGAGNQTRSSARAHHVISQYSLPLILLGHEGISLLEILIVIYLIFQP